jgi:hypothetical protein
MDINAKIAELITKLKKIPELSTSVKEELSDLGQLVGQLNVIPAMAPMVCHRCLRTDAPMYLLRRSGGKYIAICRDEDGGCWSHEQVPMCDFVDSDGVECDLIAEWEVDGVTTSCIFHVSGFLSDAEKHVLTRLD